MYVTEDELARLFPFYFCLAPQGHIVSTGPSLNRYLGESNGEESLFHHFDFDTPEVSNIEQMHDHLEEVFILRPKNHQKLILRGQFIALKEEGILFFAGCPWVSDFKTLEETGLTMEDYALYEPITYFLLLMEAQQNSLEQSESSTEELTKLNVLLEKRVERRTERLTEINQELILSRQKLQEEMQQREAVEKELRFAQKMEALGQISAGIAHEINTPIQFVGDSIFFLKESIYDLQRGLSEYESLIDKTNPENQRRIEEINQILDLDYLNERVPESLERASQGIQRVSDIIKAMKSFSRQENKQKTLASINEAIDNTLLVASSEYKYNAQVDKDLGDIRKIYCHISDINQVLLNMIVNSAHAIEERFGDKPAKIMGKIAITTRDIDDYIVITIWDNGAGIPREIIERVFDPFFTTKPVGKGTGQGLSLCHRIIHEGHNGSIKVSSAPNEGTQFEIFIPVVETLEAAEKGNEST